MTLAKNANAQLQAGTVGSLDASRCVTRPGQASRQAARWPHLQHGCRGSIHPAADVLLQHRHVPQQLSSQLAVARLQRSKHGAIAVPRQLERVLQAEPCAGAQHVLMQGCPTIQQAAMQSPTWLA
jgi:hypothetical protein